MKPEIDLTAPVFGGFAAAEGYSREFLDGGGVGGEIGVGDSFEGSFGIYAQIGAEVTQCCDDILQLRDFALDVRVVAGFDIDRIGL